MRCKAILAALTAAAALGLAAPTPASAGGLHDRLYRLGSPEDPYSYEPRKPRYYPYYHSGYWRPIEEMRGAYRYRFHLPPYQEAWGWNSREWALANPHPARRRHH
jgi:hypothetical protein